VVPAVAVVVVVDDPVQARAHQVEDPSEDRSEDPGDDHGVVGSGVGSGGAGGGGLARRAGPASQTRGCLWHASIVKVGRL
jgi:hypothetical protein